MKLTYALASVYGTFKRYYTRFRTLEYRYLCEADQLKLQV